MAYQRKPREPYNRNFSAWQAVGAVGGMIWILYESYDNTEKFTSALHLIGGVVAIGVLLLVTSAILNFNEMRNNKERLKCEIEKATDPDEIAASQARDTAYKLLRDEHNAKAATRRLARTKRKLKAREKRR